MIKFSVITCTFNAAGTLERTLRSVLDQDFQQIEHIIIDGASTDGTMRLVGKYQSESAFRTPSHRVIAVSEPDGGLYFAMNKGLRIASGDYVVFLNAGDTFAASNTLNTVASAVRGCIDLPAVVYGDTDIVDGEGRFLRHRRLAPPEKLTWKSFLKGMLVCHQAFYARTDIARDTPYDTSLRYSADVDWCIRVMREGQRRGLELRRVHAVVANYLAEGMTTANHRASLKERFRVMRRHYGLLPTFLAHVWFVFRAAVKR